MAAERGCRRGSFLFLTVAAAALAGCVGVLNPVTGEEDWSTVTEEQEIAFGVEAHEQFLAEYGYYDDPALQAYVAEIGERLLPHTHRPDFPYQFTVLDSEEVNAFATPGYVYVARGLLAQLQSEAELAALLGHELAHITARHAARRIGQRQTIKALGWLVERISGKKAVIRAADLLGEAYLSGYSRDAEREADRLGAEYATAAGYDPAAMRNLLQGLRDLERMRAAIGHPETGGGLFATHPHTGERLEEARRGSRAAAWDGEGRIGRGDYLERIDGLAVGPDPAQGLLRDGWFLYPPDRVAFRTPRDWEARNLPDRVDMRSPDGSHGLVLFLFEREPKETACDFLAAHYEGRPRVLQVGTYIGCEMRTHEGDVLVELTAVVHAEDGVLMFVAQPPAASGRHEQAVRVSLDSLRAMTDEELQAARPARLRIRAAAAGERYRDLARGAGWHEHPAAWLRVINGDWPGGEPAAGLLVKTVAQ